MISRFKLQMSMLSLLSLLVGFAFVSVAKAQNTSEVFLAEYASLKRESFDDAVRRINSSKSAAGIIQGFRAYYQKGEYRIAGYEQYQDKIVFEICFNSKSNKDGLCDRADYAIVAGKFRIKQTNSCGGFDVGFDLADQEAWNDKYLNRKGDIKWSFDKHIKRFIKGFYLRACNLNGRVYGSAYLVPGKDYSPGGIFSNGRASSLLRDIVSLQSYFLSQFFKLQ